MNRRQNEELRERDVVTIYLLCMVWMWVEWSGRKEGLGRDWNLEDGEGRESRIFF